MQEKLNLAREIASCLCGIDVRLVSYADESLTDLLRECVDISVLSSVFDRDAISGMNELKPNRMYMFTSPPGLSYFTTRLSDEDHFLIVGPCHTTEYSESKLRSLLHGFRLDNDTIQRIMAYCRWQPVLSHEKLYQFGMMLARNVLELPDPIDFRHIEFHWETSHHPIYKQMDHYEDQSHIRDIEMRYEASTALTEAVKQGNLSLALRMLQNPPGNMTALIRTPDPLRNIKNLGITLNTQMRYALEEKKIHPYRLDKLSNEIAIQIEQLKTLDEARAYFINIIRQYCELAVEKNYAHLDPLSRQAVIYIKTHLTDNLTVKRTAKALLVNANYLSGKFHRDVGMTFIDFVNQERTAQAAALLKHTNMQIQQIAAMAGYNHTSYFAKQFLRFHGVTPREYRSQGIL